MYLSVWRWKGCKLGFLKKFESLRQRKIILGSLTISKLISKISLFLDLLFFEKPPIN